jgi:hypothetical protein
MRAAFDAISTWKCRMLMIRVSISCACGSGAVMRRIGSSGKNIVPSGEAQRDEIIDHSLAEAATLGEPVDLVVREMQILQKLEHLLKPSGNEKAATRRQPPHEELEHRRSCLAMIQVGLHHVELVEIGEQRRRRVVHSAPCNRDSPAPASPVNSRLSCRSRRRAAAS